MDDTLKNNISKCGWCCVWSGKENLSAVNIDSEMRTKNAEEGNKIANEIEAKLQAQEKDSKEKNLD
jgi:hypothetical protein